MPAGEQLQSQIRGLVLLSAAVPQAWERVVQLSLGARPGAEPTCNIFFELMGRSALQSLPLSRMCIVAAAQRAVAVCTVVIVLHVPVIATSLPCSWAALLRCCVAIWHTSCQHSAKPHLARFIGTATSLVLTYL